MLDPLAQSEVVADRLGDLAGLRPCQFGLGQHDHQPHRPATEILGGADDVVVGCCVEFLFVEGRGVERVVETRYLIEAQLDCDRFDLVRDGLRCHGFDSIVGDETKPCLPATSTR